MIESMGERGTLIAKRWFDLLMYSVLAGVIVKIVVLPLGVKLLSVLYIETAIELNGLMALVALIVITLFTKLRLLHSSDFKLWEPLVWAHPPLWFAVLPAILWHFQLSSEETAALIFTVLLMGCCLFLGRFQGCDHILEELSDKEVKALSQDITQWPADKLQQWASEELPVKEGRLLFGREKYVQRIFNRLFVPVKGITREAKSLALLGELGAGKSSIINIVIKQLEERQPNWLVVKVDAWARNPANIDEQVLDLVMDTLGEVTDVTAYRGVPAAYHEALKSHRGWWAMLSHLSVGNTKTEERLKQIDDLLLLLNKKLLIVIEDPDRGEKAGVSQRCERILALIDRLQQYTSNQIKVIISGGEEVFNKDFRVIEFKEILNTPSKEYAAILNEMVNKLWCPSSCGLVLPNGKPEFSFKDFPFGTPRDVKHVIRDVGALWCEPGELRGEVELKQLVILSFLKERSHSALKYLRLFWRENEGKHDNNRYFYAWGKPHNETSVGAVEIITKEKITQNKNNTEGHARGAEQSQSVAFRLGLEAVEAHELAVWVEQLNACGRYQVATVMGRYNYLNRFDQRFSETRDATDVDYRLLEDAEKLSDQGYLRAMDNIYSDLTKNYSLNKDDVRKLLYAGQLSPYLYFKMLGKSTDQQKPLRGVVWYRLANEIIALMPTLVYSPNQLGHPASEHLIRIVDYLTNTDNLWCHRVAKLVLQKSLNTQSEAAAGLLQYPPIILFKPWLNDHSVMWGFYRSAFNNLKITPSNLDTIHWAYVKGVQQRHSDWTIFIPKELAGQDVQAIRRLVSMLECLDKTEETFQEYAECKWVAEKEAKLGEDIRSRRALLMRELKSRLSIVEQQ